MCWVHRQWLQWLQGLQSLQIRDLDRQVQVQQLVLAPRSPQVDHFKLYKLQEMMEKLNLTVSVRSTDGQRPD
jgi:hypothetical protein